VREEIRPIAIEIFPLDHNFVQGRRGGNLARSVPRPSLDQGTFQGKGIAQPANLAATKVTLEVLVGFAGPGKRREGHAKIAGRSGAIGGKSHRR